MNPFLRFLQSIGGPRSKIDERRSLHRLSRDGYEYCDGDHCLLLQIDMLRGRPDRFVYSSTIKQWLPPHENEVIVDTQRREIADRIGSSLEQAGHSVEVR